MKRYSESFKKKAVALAKKIGPSAAAAKMKVGAQNIFRWKRQSTPAGLLPGEQDTVEITISENDVRDGIARLNAMREERDSLARQNRILNAAIDRLLEEK